MIATFALVLCAASFAAALRMESTRFDTPIASLLRVPASASMSRGELR